MIKEYNYRSFTVLTDGHGSLAFSPRLARLFGVQQSVWLFAAELPHHVRVWTAQKIRQAIRFGSVD
jgi:hypothetical protein